MLKGGGYQLQCDCANPEQGRNLTNFRQCQSEFTNLSLQKRKQYMRSISSNRNFCRYVISKARGYHLRGDRANPKLGKKSLKI